MANLVLPSVLFAGVALYLAVSPLPRNISPAKVPNLKASPLEGPYTPNDALQNIERFGAGIGGAEDIVVDAEGNLFSGTLNGWVYQVKDDGSFEEWAYTGGRPLGGKFDDNGDLVIAVTGVGLCRINRTTKAVTILANMVDGRPILAANNLDIASDGKIYFSDSTDIITPIKLDLTYDVLGTSVYSYFRGKFSGRLLVHDPETGRTTSLLRTRLWFANGVALSTDEDFVLVASTFSLEILRYHLKGKYAGQVDKFLTNIPGTPDNINRAADGSFYVGVPKPWTGILKLLSPYPTLRGLSARMFGMGPIRTAMEKAAPDYGMVLKVSSDGKVVQSWQDPSGGVGRIAGATEHDGFLYLGSFSNDFIGKVKL